MANNTELSQDRKTCSLIERRPINNVVVGNAREKSTDVLVNQGINVNRGDKHIFKDQVRVRNDGRGRNRDHGVRSRDLSKCKQKGDDVTDQMKVLRTGNRHKLKILGDENKLNKYKNSKNKYMKQQSIRIWNYLRGFYKLITLIFFSLFSAIGLRGLHCLSGVLHHPP